MLRQEKTFLTHVPLLHHGKHEVSPQQVGRSISADLPSEGIQCIIMGFLKTWVTELTPDTNTTLYGFRIIGTDRTTESGNGKAQEVWKCLTYMVVGEIKLNVILLFKYIKQRRQRMGK